MPEPAPQPPTHAALIARLTYGTTTKPGTVEVVWQGEHLALVKRKGETGWAGRGSRSYRRTYYEALDVHHVGGMGSAALDVITGRNLVPNMWQALPQGVLSVYRWGATVDLAATKAHALPVEDWIAHLKTLDAAYPRLRAEVKAAMKIEEEAKKAKAEKERAEFARLNRLVKAAPQMLMALKEAREALLGAAHDRHSEGSPALDTVIAAIAAAEEG